MGLRAVAIPYFMRHGEGRIRILPPIANGPGRGGRAGGLSAASRHRQMMGSRPDVAHILTFARHRMRVRS